MIPRRKNSKKVLITSFPPISRLCRGQSSRRMAMNSNRFRLLSSSSTSFESDLCEIYVRRPPHIYSL